MTFLASRDLFNLAIILVFLTGTGLPLLGNVLDDSTGISTSEKRHLNTLPEAPRSKKEFKRYPEKFNLYYQDQFGFRADLVQAYNRTKMAMGDSPSEKVILGKNGWLFYRGIADDDLINATRGIRKYNPPELEQYARVLQARYDWLAKRDIQYIFVIAPNKHTVYPEYLPDHMYQVNTDTLTDQFTDYMVRHTTVPIIDLRQPLIDSKSDGRLLYFKSDTHWNHYGSSIAQFEIANALAKSFPDQIKPISYQADDFRVREGKGGDLSIFIGSRDQFSELYPRPKFDPCTKRPTPASGNFAETFTTQCGKSDLNTVVFRDSFFTWLHPYMSQYFKRATFTGLPLDYSHLNKLVERHKPAVVIQQLAERTLTRIPVMDAEFLQSD